MAKVYCAGPMRGHPVKVAMDWRFTLANELSDQGHVALIPGIAEGVQDLQTQELMHMPTKADGEQVVKVDCHLVQISDYVVANLSYAVKMPTGTLAEISWAYILDVPVIVIGDNEYTREPFIATQATMTVPTVEDALHAIACLEGIWK